MMNPSQGIENDMTRPYSLAFKQRMLQRLTGKDALSASQLARETGVRQQNLSRWLEEARSLPLVASDDIKVRKWTVEQKARVLSEASHLSGEQLRAYLEREGVDSLTSSAGGSRSRRTGETRFRRPSGSANSSASSPARKRP